MTRMTRRSATVIILAALGACATVGGGEPEPSYPDVSGTWTGAVTVEGQAIDGTLELSQEGPELHAVFQAPGFGITAEGDGRITPEGQITVVLGYNLECPGSAEMSGESSDDGTLLSGSLDAADCTGQMFGTFRFRR